MKLKLTASPKDIIFLNDISDLEKFDLKEKSKKSFVLNGPLLLTYTGSLKQNLNYIPQEPRAASLQLIPKNNNKIIVSLKKEALNFFAKNKIKPIFGLDGLLKSCAKIKDEEFYYFFATSNELKSYITCLQINKKEVVQIYNFEANPSESPSFNEDIHNLIERLQQTKSIKNMYWAGPLTPPSTQDLSTIKIEWQNVKSNSITATGGPSKLEKYGVAASILILTLMVGSYLVYSPYSAYLKEKEIFLAETKKFESQQVFTSERLNLLKTKNSFMLENEKNKIDFDKIQVVLSYLKSKDIVLEELVLNSIIAEVPGDFSFVITIQVAAEEGKTPLTQGYDLLTDMARETGFSYKLPSSGSYSEVKSSLKEAGPLRVKYTIEGVFK